MRDMKRGCRSITERLAYTIAACAFVLLGLLAVPQQALAANISSLSGVDRYDTAAQEARLAYPGGADTAIVVGGENWPDAVTASGLAGIVDAPILFTNRDGLNGYAANALRTLHVKKVIIVGGPNSVSGAAESAIRGMVGSVIRLAGADRYGTQMAVYEYGRLGYDGTDHWNQDIAIIARGENFPDALSISALAFKCKAPVFLTSGGVLNQDQKNALSAVPRANELVLGGDQVVAQSTIGYLDALCIAATGNGSARSTRLYGADRYGTNLAINNWCVGKGYLSWDKAGVASGEKPYDSLAGSPLSGRNGAVTVLVGNATSASIGAFAKASGSVSSYTYFGGTAAISDPIRRYINDSLWAGNSLAFGFHNLPNGSRYYADASGLYDQGQIDSHNKIGWQNPSWMWQVSPNNVTGWWTVGHGIFSYASPSRITPTASRADVVNAFIQRAREYVGTRYVWDYACAPGVGVDCAGLCVQCCYAVGMDLGDMNPYNHYYLGLGGGWHAAYANAFWNSSHVRRIAIRDAQPGDLISYPGHIAIYIGNGTMIEALGANVHYAPLRYRNARGAIRIFN